MAKFNLFSFLTIPFKAFYGLKLKHAKNSPFANKLKGILQFSPVNPEYYNQAFTHRSAALTNEDGSPKNNERLEYLGDALLGAVIADMLFHKYPFADEGFLTQMRSKIVSRENLNKLAQDIGISKFIISNTSNANTGKHILGDTFEAFIGAIYLDKGYKNAENFIVNRMIKDFVDLDMLESSDTNYKSQLIEWGQKYKREIKFSTELISEESKLFLSKVLIDNKETGKGKGKSKKEAEQLAAKTTLAKVENEYEMPEDLQFTLLD